MHICAILIKFIETYLYYNINLYIYIYIKLKLTGAAAGELACRTPGLIRPVTGQTPIFGAKNGERCSNNFKNKQKNLKEKNRVKT